MKAPLVIVSVSLTLAIIVVALFLIMTQTQRQAPVVPSTGHIEKTTDTPRVSLLFP
jgi:regulator of protease activity HflC (stomatin/prohibitin superfamily)